MSKDDTLKSAYELAMERLAAQDKERGEERKPLSAAQRESIAELRRQAQAKLAELEILQRKALSGAAADPDKLTELEERYERDRRRVASSLESAIARVRRGERVESLG